MSARYVSFEELCPVLEWLVCQRPESVHAHFSLFRIGFENPDVLGSTFGAPDAMRRLNEFGSMLATTVRGGDLVARDLTAFWILTPECNADKVGCRLCEIVNGVQNFGLDVVDSSVGAYLFPLKDVNLAGADTRKIIDRLQAMPPHFKFDPAHDCAVSWMTRTGNKLEDWRGNIQKNCYRLRTEFPPASNPATERAAAAPGPPALDQRPLPP
jgi:hypothetical protein